MKYKGNAESIESWANNVQIREDNRNQVDKEELDSVMMPRFFDGGYSRLVPGYVS